MTPLEGKNVVLCVCGSIAAYKAADLTSKLVQAGAVVDVILSQAAREFVTPFTFRSLTGRAVYGDMFAPVSDAGEEHVALARRADIVIVAPATANTLARLTHGLADDMTSLTVLATTAPLLIAPAMDAQMWAAAATQANVKTLNDRGATFVGPEAGRLASGHVGLGRLADTESIIGAAKVVLARDGDLKGRHIVVSAGGTREAIDPVRFIGNASSGKMGYALAEAARDRGARVTLISSVDTLPTPAGVTKVPMSSVTQLREAVLKATRDGDALIMAAAVSDFRPSDVGAQKIKRTDAEGGMTLQLVENEDFFHEVPDSVIKVAFAAETQNVVENAKRKPRTHGHLDLICANDVSALDSGFGTDTNRVWIIDAAGEVEDLPLLSKYEVGHRILDRVLPLIEQKHPRT
jgi:phosphopantothenoylcysteine decarboxylase / phosphopantothenate---cysteine ligase